MKEKYIITINNKTKNVTLEALGELNKEEFFTLTTNQYPNIIIKDLPKGKKAVIEALRNPKFFPPYKTTAAIADTIIHMASENKNFEKILINDKDYIQKAEEEEHEDNKTASKTTDDDGEFINIIEENIDRDDIDENVNIDELLQDGDNINVSSGIKIAEDDIEKPGVTENDI
ncbi:MAG: hypothetical protein JRJ44_03715 [Deltaproteobacteria bacterium]|nr:hypothetical protein [Deltaproteobacteria bacterium]